MTAGKISAGVTATVLVHGVVVLLHARAHSTLAVNMSALQNGFIGVVIMAAPIVAGVLVWTPYRRTGTLTLAVTMFAALIFGAYHHFFEAGVDHVSAVPTHGWGAVFRLSAFLLAAVEGWGSLVGWWGFRCLQRARAGN